MITTLRGQNFRDTLGRVKAVLRQNLDDHSPDSPIPKEEIYRVCLSLLWEMDTRMAQMQRNNRRYQMIIQNYKKGRNESNGQGTL